MKQSSLIVFGYIGIDISCIDEDITWSESYKVAARTKTKTLEPPSRPKDDLFMNDHFTDRDLPKRSLAFLNWFCPDHLIEGILGDLIERYQKDLKKLGKKKLTDYSS